MATIYLDTAETMVVEERPATTGADLVADVGGMLGLLLGYSAFTLIGQLERVLAALVRRLGGRGRGGGCYRRQQEVGVEGERGGHRRSASAPPQQLPPHTDIAVDLT